MKYSKGDQPKLTWVKPFWKPAVNFRQEDVKTCGSYRDTLYITLGLKEYERGTPKEKVGTNIL